MLDEDAAETYCAEQVSNTALELHGGSMPVVEYFVPKSEIPYGFNRYATDSGFKNKFYISLHEAEQRYAPNCEEIFTAQQCFDYAQDTSKTYLHQVETWEEVGLTDLDDGYTPGEMIESWTTANASRTTNKIISKSGTVDEPDVFSGGFAPHCKTGTKWKYLTSAQAGPDNPAGGYCSGELSWEFDFHVPNVQSQTGTKTVGVFLHRDIFFEDAVEIELGNYPDQSFAGAWYQENDKIATLERVRVQCYPGSTDKEVDWTKSDVTTFDLPDTVDETVFVTDEISLNGESAYTCEFQLKIKKPDGSKSWIGDLGSANEVDYRTAEKNMNIDEFIGGNKGTLRDTGRAKKELISN